MLRQLVIDISQVDQKQEVQMNRTSEKKSKGSRNLQLDLGVVTTTARDAAIIAAGLYYNKV
jgi:hypothetical protein